MRPARERSSWTRPTPKPMAARGCPPSLYWSSGVPASAAVDASRPPVVITTSGRSRSRAAANAGQRLRRLPGVAGGDDQGARSGAGREAVVAVDDERHLEAITGRGGDQLGADRGAPHGKHDDRVDVGVALVQDDRRRDPTRLHQLLRQLRHAAEHVVRVDPLAGGRVVEGDRLLEERRTTALVALVGRVGASGLLVRILVAEVVLGVHQRPPAAILRPSASRASTSSGERASA